MIKRPLILDIDFTLIHLEFVPDSIEVPGRTRSAWLAPRTVETLDELQVNFEIILATARSWEGTRWVCDGLDARGVRVENVVIEDGARLGKVGGLYPFARDYDATQTREIYAPRASWPAFEWQLDFQDCAVARCETPDYAAQLTTIFAARIAPEERVYRDGRKVYILPRGADKWSALQRLLGTRASQSAGVGDGENDGVWLPEVKSPATFEDAASSLVEVVRARGGLIGGPRSHTAVVELLGALEN